MLSVKHPRLPYVLVLTFVAAAWAASAWAGDKPLTFADLMKFRTIRDPVISKDGGWIAYGLAPDRGDGEAVARAVAGDAEYLIERGAGPKISGDGRWVAAAIEPSLEEREKAEGKGGQGKGKNDEPKMGMALLDLRDGSETRVDKVESFAFSEDGRWLAYKLYREEEEEGEAEEEAPSPEAEPAEPELEEPEPGSPAAEEPEPAEKTEDEKGKDEDEEELGSTLMLRDLASGDETALEHVTEYAFDKPSAFLAYAVSAPQGQGNGVLVRRLRRDAADQILHQQEKGRYTQLTWAKGSKEKRHSLLAFVAAAVDEDGETGDAAVWVWEGTGEARQAAARDDAPEGWTVPSVNELRWSRDGQRLFFGLKPVEEEGEKEDEDEDEDEKPFDPYDLEALLDKRGVDVWHWNDPLINSNQKKRWKDEKDRTYRAVWHRGSGRVIALADREVRNVEPPDNPRFALAKADTPHLKEVTWNGRLFDLWVVDLESGERRRVAERLRHSAALSPGGRFVAFYVDGHWFL